LMVPPFRGSPRVLRLRLGLAYELGITPKERGRYCAKVRSFVAQSLSARGV